MIKVELRRHRTECCCKNIHLSVRVSVHTFDLFLMQTFVPMKGSLIVRAYKDIVKQCFASGNNLGKVLSIQNYSAVCSKPGPYAEMSSHFGLEDCSDLNPVQHILG